MPRFGARGNDDERNGGIRNCGRRYIAGLLCADDTFAEQPRKSEVAAIGDVENMREQFLSTVGLLRFQTAGSSDERAERVIALVRAKVDENFEVIRARLLDDAERQAAQAGKKN